MRPGDSVHASDEVHYIIPLGLTLGEARGWYLHQILVPVLRRAAVAMAAGLALLSVTLTGAKGVLNGTLPMNFIVQHVLVIAAGFLLAYGVSKVEYAKSRLSGRTWGFPRITWWSNSHPLEWTVGMFATAAFLTVFWYLPHQFNATVNGASPYFTMEGVFLLVGSLIFFGSRFLSERLKFVAAIVVGKLMGLFGMILLLVPYRIYQTYPAYEQALTGVALLIMMVVIDFTAVPLLLYRFFGKNSPPKRISMV